MKTSREIAERLRELERHESRLPDEAAVHEMRVAARRLRAALRILRLRSLDRGVKALQDALGVVRDLQLQTDWLRGRDASLAQARERELRKAERALAKALREWRARTLPALLDAAAHAGAPHRGRVKKVVRKRLRRLEERLDEARARPTARSLHRARISVKQVRYLVEVGGDLLPPQAARIAADLRPLQASLGQLHDTDVRIGLVERRPLLLREQREARERLSKIVAAQLSRWKKLKVASRARRRLR